MVVAADQWAYDKMTGIPPIENPEPRSSSGTRRLTRRAYLKYVAGATAAVIAGIAAYWAIKPKEGTTSATGTAQTTRTVYTGETSLAPHELIVEPDDGRTAILAALQDAKRSVDLTIYELDDPQVEASLVAARNRGVDIRVLYNYHSFAAEGVKDPNQPTVDALTRVGIQTRRASGSFAVTHQKTFLIDGSVAIIMTFNLGSNYFQGTRDLGIITTDAAEVMEVQRVFEGDWNYERVAPTLPALVWSPDNSREKILNLINRAARTLDVYSEEVGDQECIEALISAAKRGVTVRLLSAQMLKEGRDLNAPARQTLGDGGVQAKAGTGLYTHAKMILVDYGRGGQTAFIGSENLSSASLDKNRELGILVTEQAILDRLCNVFENDWAGG